MSRPPRGLPSGEAHVWYAWTDAACTPARLDAWRSLLSGDERQRLDRLRFDHLKSEYLLTRALCRHTLSHYADVAPADWRFGANAHGRPHLAAPDVLPTLRFNLANARSLVACVVADGIDAGIDVERVDRAVEVAGIGDAHFSASESESLRALDPERRRARFFTLWTLKEAYLKARGLGLSIPLDQCVFDLDGPPPIRALFGPALDDRTADWHFECIEPAPGYRMAIALRRGDRPDLRVRLIETIPGA